MARLLITLVDLSLRFASDKNPPARVSRHAKTCFVWKISAHGRRHFAPQCLIN